MFLLNSCSDVCGLPIATYASLHCHGNWRGRMQVACRELGEVLGSCLIADVEQQTVVCLQAAHLLHHMEAERIQCPGKVFTPLELFPVVVLQQQWTSMYFVGILYHKPPQSSAVHLYSVPVSLISVQWRGLNTNESHFSDFFAYQIINK